MAILTASSGTSKYLYPVIEIVFVITMIGGTAYAIKRNKDKKRELEESMKNLKNVFNNETNVFAFGFACVHTILIAN